MPIKPNGQVGHPKLDPHTLAKRTLQAWESMLGPYSLWSIFDNLFNEYYDVYIVISFVLSMTLSQMT